MTRRELIKLMAASPLLFTKYAQAEIGDGVKLPTSSKGIGCPALIRGTGGSRCLSLTFDDGPEPILTPRLLSILRALNVKATFFVIGEKVDKHPDIVRQMVDEGHEVENHSYYHLRMARIPNDMVSWEIQQGALAIERVTGRRPQFLRPPGGEYSSSVAKACSQNKSILALWSQDPADYEAPSPDVITNRLLHTTRSGGVILLHEKVRPTMQSVPEFVAAARARGYHFIKLSEMWKARS